VDEADRVDAVFEGKAISPREYDMKFRTKSPQAPDDAPTIPRLNYRRRDAYADPSVGASVSVLCPSPVTLVFWKAEPAAWGAS
jgi:hypothetical protein